jgi:hypothetical protein
MTRENMALKRIQKEIEDELVLIHRVISEYSSIPENTEEWIRIRTKASLLHDFYTGVERIFSRIAQELNGGIPNTEEWHKDLLNDMTLDLDEVRPPVISKNLYDQLIPYLRFRHLFRNLYGFELDWERMKELDENLSRISSQWLKEIHAFLDWMKSVTKI